MPEYCKIVTIVYRIIGLSYIHKYFCLLYVNGKMFFVYLKYSQLHIYIKQFVKWYSSFYCNELRIFISIRLFLIPALAEIFSTINDWQRDGKNEYFIMQYGFFEVLPETYLVVHSDPFDLIVNLVPNVNSDIHRHHCMIYPSQYVSS